MTEGGYPPEGETFKLTAGKTVHYVAFREPPAPRVCRSAVVTNGDGSDVGECGAELAVFGPRGPEPVKAVWGCMGYRPYGEWHHFWQCPDETA